MKNNQNGFSKEAIIISL